MRTISERMVSIIKTMYPVGCRVVLERMEDPWAHIKPGTKGTVKCVDDIGTIHVNWDNGSSLGIVYGEDSCRTLEEGEE